jgi:O-antigen biosynthesis protein
MRAVFLAHSARRGDAMGRQIAGKMQALRSQGWDGRLFVEDASHLHDAVSEHGAAHTAASLWHHPADRAYLLDADVCFVEFGCAFDLLNLMPVLTGKKPRLIFTYYGLTPLQLWESNDRARLQTAHQFRGYVWFADHAFANSHFAAEELHQATGYPRERIHILPCLIDPPADYSSPMELRRRIAAEKAWVLLFVGRMAANKRPGLLIKALARLSNLDRPVHGVFLGPQNDIYAAETTRCQEMAHALGVTKRAHFLGNVSEAELWGWYHAADAFVLPSVHEGFGMTAVEAMACNLPVVVAKAGALPETVSDAGLTFIPDNLDDLERQLRRILTVQIPNDVGYKGKVGVVSPRFGTSFAGGAETSLRTMAKALQQSGHAVEVFTTCNRHDSRWGNHLPAGTTMDDGLTVHRFPIDPFDLDQHVAACEVIGQRRGDVTEDVEKRFLHHSLNSTSLVQTLSVRKEEFAAVITGPYLFGLIAQVAEALGDRLLLAPCFHDEPTAYLRVFQKAFQHVGGLLYHSRAEQHLAETKLGHQNPNSVVVGTLLAQSMVGDAERGRQLCGPNYVVYCGRYCPEKGLPELIDFIGRYQAEHPDRYRLVCMGQGAMRLPRQPYIIDLGFVSEEVKRDVLAGAKGLILLSPNESLSIVMLEAWLQGIPVIGTEKCAVVKEQIERSRGGFAIGSFEEFRAVLDRLYKEPAVGLAAGSAGRNFTLQNYTNPQAYAARLETALRQQSMPLPLLLRQRGTERAKQFLPTTWQPQFLQLIEELADKPRPTVRRQAQVHHAATEKVSSPGGKCLLSLRVENTGTIPLITTGPRTCFLWCVLRDKAGQVQAKPQRTRLPSMLLPGQTLAVAVAMTVPSAPGDYTVQVLAGPRKGVRGRTNMRNHGMKLTVVQQAAGSVDLPGDDFLQAAQAAVRQAHERGQLPQDYIDVTEGALAAVKRFLKRKLLHNFRKAYVDVMSRQQSEVNEALVTALCHLLDGYTVLSRKVADLEAARSRPRRRSARQAAPHAKDEPSCDAS